MAQGGLALATSLAAAFNVGALFIILIKRLGGFPFSQFFLSIIRICGASAIMGCILDVCPGRWEIGQRGLPN